MATAESYIAPASRTSEDPRPEEDPELLRFMDYLEEHRRWVMGSSAPEPRHEGLRLVGADLRHVDGLKQDHLARCDLTDASLPDGLAGYSVRLGLIEEASKNCRALFLTVLAVCTFLIISVGKMDDATLILGGSSFPLPLVETEVPALGFLFAAPLFLAGLSFYFHLYLQRLWELVARLPAVFTDGRTVTECIYPWLLVGTVQRHFPLARRRPSLARMQSFAGTFLAWGLAPLTAWFMWWSSLPRQDEPLNFLQFLIASAMTVFSLGSHERAGRTLSGSSSGKRRGRVVAVYFLVAAMVLSLAVALVAEFRPKPGRLQAENAELSGQDLRGLHLQGANLMGANLAGADLRNADLTGANLSYANLQDADLSKATLDRANLSSAELNRAILNETSMVKVNGSGAKLEDIQMNLGWLTDANFSGAVWNRAKVSNSHAHQVQFSGASLRWAHFLRVDLTGANLSDADLQYVDLSDSTLKKARLGGATLKETRLTGANLAGAIGFRLEQFAQTCGESSVEVTLTEGEGVDRSATFGSQTLRRCAAQLDELRRDLLVAKAEEQQADTQQERTAAKQRTEQIQQQVQAAEHDGNAMRQDVQKLAAQQGLSIQQLAPSRPEALSAQRARDIEAAEATATAAQLDAINRCASYGEDLHAQATVLVTFENSGKVSEARVLTRPFAGTRKGSCLQSYFGRKAMRPFSGAPISVKKTFYL